MLQLALIMCSIAFVNLLLFDSLVVRIFMDVPEGYVGFGGSPRANCVISAIGVMFLSKGSFTLHD